MSNDDTSSIRVKYDGIKITKEVDGCKVELFLNTNEVMDIIEELPAFIRKNSDAYGIGIRGLIIDHIKSMDEKGMFDDRPCYGCGKLMDAFKYYSNQGVCDECISKWESDGYE